MVLIFCLLGNLRHFCHGAISDKGRLWGRMGSSYFRSTSGSVCLYLYRLRLHWRLEATTKVTKSITVRLTVRTLTFCLCLKMQSSNIIFHVWICEQEWVFFLIDNETTCIYTKLFPPTNTVWFCKVHRRMVKTLSFLTKLRWLSSKHIQ